MISFHYFICELNSAAWRSALERRFNDDHYERKLMVQDSHVAYFSN